MRCMGDSAWGLALDRVLFGLVASRGTCGGSESMFRCKRVGLGGVECLDIRVHVDELIDRYIVWGSVRTDWHSTGRGEARKPQ
jgi:hypothetical protein